MAKPKKSAQQVAAPEVPAVPVAEPAPAPTFACTSCEKVTPLTEARMFRHHPLCGSCFAGRE